MSALRRRLSAILPPTSRRRSYAASVGTGYLYTATAAIVNLLLIPVLVNGLGTFRFGIWITLYALGHWIHVAVSWLNPGIIKRIGAHRTREEIEVAEALTSTVAVGYSVLASCVVLSGIAAATVGSVSFLGGRLPSTERIAILVTACWIAMRMRSNIWTNVLAAAQRLYTVHTIQSLTLLGGGVLAAISVLAGLGLVGVAGSYLAAEVVAYGFYRSRGHAAMHRSGKHGFRTDLLKDVAKLSIPYAMSGVGILLLTSDIVLLAVLTGPEKVATYGVVYKLVEAMIQVIWRISDTSQPYAIELDTRNDRSGLAALHADILSISLLLGGSAVAFLWILGPDFLTMWVGSAAPGDAVVMTLSIYLLLQSFVHANMVFPYSTARMRTIGPLLVFEGITKVIIAVILVPRTGLVGPPQASIAAMVLFSSWYVPLFTVRWLGIDVRRLIPHVAKASVAAPLLTLLVAAIASKFITEPSILQVGSATLLAVVAMCIGALPSARRIAATTISS